MCAPVKLLSTLFSISVCTVHGLLTGGSGLGLIFCTQSQCVTEVFNVTFLVIWVKLKTSFIYLSVSHKLYGCSLENTHFMIESKEDR